MAILSKIRSRSVLLISIIAFSLFAFIAQDLFRKGNFGESTKDVGSVNGENILYQTFNEKVIGLEKNGQGTTNIQAVNKVWDQEVNVALLTAEFKKLGLRVGNNHIIDALKQNQNIGQNPMFLNEKKEFDLAKFKEYFKSNPEMAESFKSTESDAVLNSKFQLYSTLIKGGSYSTKADAKAQFAFESNKVSFDFVTLPFTSIKDTDVKISDTEITDYIKTNEKKYKLDEIREVQYALIEDKPSLADENETKEEVNKILPEFTAAANVSEFVNSNSEVAYDSTYVSKNDLPADVAPMLFGLTQGSVSAPYMNGKYYSVSKSLGRKIGVKAKASHVLIGYEGSKAQGQKEKRTKEQAKAKAEGILAQALANPQGFMMLAFQFSEDQSAQQGGDLGYFSQGQLPKPMDSFMFSNGIGKIGIVETEFGFHIINITDKQDGVRLATIAKKIAPSEQTSDAIYNQATKLEAAANAKPFEDAAKEMKVVLAPIAKFKALDESVGTLGTQRQVIRWAFNKETNVNDVKRFEVANLGQVIAKLKKVNKEGLMSAEEARPMVETILKNKKKAELLKAKLKGTLESAASTNATTVQLAPDATMQNSVLPNAGQEPKVVGIAFATATNKTSAPIVGNSGVFMIRTKSVLKAPVTDLKPISEKLKQQGAGIVNGVIPALKSDAKIEDYRAKFNY
jgi:peptidyl-prolyl cis-trans isomerase D